MKNTLYYYLFLFLRYFLVQLFWAELDQYCNLHRPAKPEEAGSVVSCAGMQNIWEGQDQHGHKSLFNNYLDDLKGDKEV